MGPIIGAVAAVLVVAVGVAATFFVLNRSSTDDAGKANPTEAATNLVNSLSQGDVLGVLESLTPAESALLVDFNAKSTDRLKELKVYKEDADPNTLHGASVEAKNLKYDEKNAEKVNDHLTITKLVGGTVSLHADVNELPLTEEFMEAAFPDGVNSQPTDEQVDVADVVRDTGQPIRIATVNVDGKWYPSLFYTVADYALQDAGKEWPSELDREQRRGRRRGRGQGDGAGGDQQRRRARDRAAAAGRDGRAARRRPGAAGGDGQPAADGRRGHQAGDRRDRRGVRRHEGDAVGDRGQRRGRDLHGQEGRRLLHRRGRGPDRADLRQRPAARRWAAPA